jgi:hypothetical protein
MRLWSARISLLGRFAAMGVVVVVAVGLATELVLKQQIERRALDRTVQDATVIAKLGVQPSLKRGDLRFPIPLTRLSELASLSCDIAQGFHISRPLPADAPAVRLQAESVSLRGPARNPSASSVDS